MSTQVQQPEHLQEEHAGLAEEPMGTFFVYNTGRTETTRINLSVPGKQHLDPFRKALRYFQDNGVEVVNALHTIESAYIYINTEDQAWDKEFRAQVEGWDWLDVQA
ncbi:hypothetical protein BDQ17DRAFT_1432262 [Cyathus striatus]|nr:hypothetical protein BDQ17DRAFT_1432262 [Cyathus striatus]